MHKINQDLHFLIHGRKGDKEILMIPVYNPNIGQYLSEKLAQEQYWDEFYVETPDNKIIYQHKRGH